VSSRRTQNEWKRRSQLWERHGEYDDQRAPCAAVQVFHLSAAGSRRPRKDCCGKVQTGGSSRWVKEVERIVDLLGMPVEVDSPA